MDHAIEHIEIARMIQRSGLPVDATFPITFRTWRKLDA